MEDPAPHHSRQHCGHAPSLQPEPPLDVDNAHVLCGGQLRLVASTDKGEEAVRKVREDVKGNGLSSRLEPLR